MERLDEALNGMLISGRRAPDGGGWCYYCNTHHERVETKRTPCCGDCWFDEAPMSALEAGITLTSSDPEPPQGTVVRDALGHVWEHSDDFWAPIDRDDDTESWVKVAGNYGPVVVL